MPGTLWSQEELNILDSNYEWDPQIYVKIPTRSYQAVNFQAFQRGLYKNGRGNISTLKADYFDHWFSQMAWVVGFFTADGNMFRGQYGNRGEIWRVTFTQKDPLMLRVICDQLGIPETYIKGIDGKFNYPGGYSKITEEPVHRIAFTNKHIFESLEALGLEADKSCRMQKVNVPKKYFNDFLRGYFEGDGCFSWSTNTKNGTPRVSFTGGSRQFLKWLESRISDNVNLPGGRLRQRKDSNVWSLVYRKATSLAIMKYMYNNLDDETLFMPRKLDNYLSYLNYHEMDLSAHETPRSDMFRVRYSPTVEYTIYTNKCTI